MGKDIEQMTPEEIIAYLKGVDSKQVSNYIAENIDAHLEKGGVCISCPSCGNKEKVKNGTYASGIVRYKCKNCGKKFAPTTNTIFEGTDYTWGEMVNAVYGVITKQSLEYIAYNTSTSPLSLGNAWLLQMKILYILASIPKPCLEGVIQVDEKYFRENQKGSHDLKSFLDPSEQRWARRHNYRSECGIFGPEFINVLCAVDEHHNHYAKCVSLGPLFDGALDDLEHHMKNVSYLCTDSLLIYKEWSEKNRWLHYVEPSGYRKERKSRGYVDTDNVYRKLTEEEYHKNKKINMALYKDKKYPYIENSETEIDYDQFVSLRYKFNLNINAVNSFHSQLEKDIVKNKTGVSSALLGESGHGQNPCLLFNRTKKRGCRTDLIIH